MKIAIKEYDAHMKRKGFLVGLSSSQHLDETGPELGCLLLQLYCMVCLFEIRTPKPSIHKSRAIFSPRGRRN